MNRRDDHHDQQHRRTNSKAASSFAAATSSLTERNQPTGVDPVEHGYDALMSSLDNVSAHDELHRMPEACQTALQQAIKQMLEHSNNNNISSSSSSNGMNAAAVLAAIAAASAASAAASAAGGGPAVGDDRYGEEGKGDGVQKAKGVVVIEGEMGCGKQETVTWLKRVCCKRYVCLSYD